MFRLIALTAALAFLAACGGDEPARTEPRPSEAPLTAPEADGGVRLAVSEDGGSVLPPLRAEEFTPRFTFDAPAGEAPTKVMIDFPGRPAEDQLGVENGRTRASVLVTPTVAVNVTVPSLGIVEVGFPGGLLPDTEYRVTLTSIESRSGTLKRPEKEGAWTTTFKTPPLTLKNVQVLGYVPKSQTADVELHFSGPVDAERITSLIAIQVEGRAADRVSLSRASGRSVVLQIKSSAIREGAAIQLVLQKGRASGNNEIAARTVEVKLPANLLRIEYAHLQEGPSGFFIEVNCTAYKPNGERLGGWDRGCELGEGAEEKITVEPAVPVSIAPTRYGFRIFGDFARGPLQLRIASGLVANGDAVLAADLVQSFNRPARQPRLSFTAVGRYLPRSAWKNLGITHVNVKDVEVTVRHVPPENLIFWMSNEQGDAADARTSNVLVHKVIPVQGKDDQPVTSWIDVASLLPTTPRGVLQITLSGAGQSASSRLLITDMSVVAKRMATVSPKSTEAVKVWALGIEDTLLLEDVEVTAVRPSGQVLARCKTAGANGCVLEIPKDPVDPTEPFALIARKGEDLTYLRYSDLKLEISESDVSGESYQSERPYRLALWTDRGVYRPGDTAHVSAVVRDNTNVAPRADLPLELTVVDPRQRVLRRSVLQTNAAGLVSVDVPFETFADTGVYSLRFSIADRQVASTTINVEEFVPERMKVTATATAAGFALGEPVAFDIEAAYLFGGSAEGSPVELQCQLEPSRFEPPNGRDFRYDVWRDETRRAKPLTLGQAKGTLGPKGAQKLSCPAAETSLPFRGAAQLVAQAAVFEAGSGRSSQTQVRVPVHPERYYLGLKTTATRAEAGKPIRISGVVVDWQGVLAPGAVKALEVEYARQEFEYGYSWDEAEGSERYRRYLRSSREGRTTVPVKPDGTFQFEVTPASQGAGYLVKVRSGNAQTDLRLEGDYHDWYWYEGEGNQQVDMTPRPSRPTSLAVSVPKRARIGEPIVATVKVPYKGRILFTAETDRVLGSEWREVQAGEAKWEFSPKEFAPTIYVSALLVKDPHLEASESFLPDRAFGVASLPIEPTEFTHELKLTVPNEIRSGATLEVELDLGPQSEPTFATIAAVDEGILRLTRFESPNPLAQIFTKRALGVTTYETLGWTLLMPPQGNSRSTGGDDEGADAGGRVQPVKPVALWSGVVEVPASGKTKVRFPVPQFRGALRVMAVSVGPKRIGRASAEVKVRDPITLSTTLPRFLIQNDTVQIPVFVTNLAGKPLDVTVSLSAEDLAVPGLELRPGKESPLQLLGKSQGSLSLQDGKSGTLVFQARATKAIGAAKLTVRASGGGHQSVETLDVPFAPPGPRERLVSKIELAQGTTPLAPALQGWVPTTERSSVWVTTNPYGPAFDHLSYLVRYPYGCLEQTTSSARPLLAMPQLLDRVDPSLLADGSIEEKVQSGVNRILSMQTPSGAFSYWPGSVEPSPWSTAYAVHFLLDAKKAKYTVPQERLDDALTWLGREVERYENAEPTRRDWRWGDIRQNEAYSHYVLAVGGKPRKAAIQKRISALPAKDTWTGMELENAYLLKAALWLSGDRRYEADLRALEETTVPTGRENNWSFYSDQRRRGLMLSVFTDLFGNDPAGESLAQQIAEQLQRQRSSGYTTQELLWSVTALGKRLGGVAADYSTPVLTAGAKKFDAKVKPQEKSSERTWSLARASEYPELAVTVDKKGEGRLFAIVSSEGVRTGAKWKEGGRSLTITRTFRARDGKSLSLLGGSAELADLIFVEVSVKNTTNAAIQNLAMVSRIPAGWEIENPRLGRGGEVEWVSPDDLWAPDYLAVKDDRLEVFGAIGPQQTKKVVFAVRAVTAGSYTLPPAEIEAMYDPSIWAREGGGQTEVAGPWKDFLL